MTIDFNTRFITLIGEPLSQSFAARMQNAGYEAGGINMRYFYTESGQEHLGEIIGGIRSMPSFAGCAVTKPNKVAVLQYLDELDPLCEKIGACNTVVKRNGKLIGYNTDAEGFIRGLEEDAGISVKDKTFFCMGAGGAGRAVCAALAWHRAGRIIISDICFSAAVKLAEDIRRGFGVSAEAVHGDDFSETAVSEVLINASGVGMGRSEGTSPIPEEYIKPSHFCYDTCYNPEKTRFLMDAEKKGCRTANGLSMSLYQGVEQIRLWTGREADAACMRHELEEITAEMHRKEDL